MSSGPSFRQYPQFHDDIHGVVNPVFETQEGDKIMGRFAVGPVRKKGVVDNRNILPQVASSSSIESQDRPITFTARPKINQQDHLTEFNGGSRSNIITQPTKPLPNGSNEETEYALWAKLCPFSFCPTFRQFARILAFLIIGSLVWGIIYFVFGNTVLPGGQLFQLIFLCVSAHFGGSLMRMTTMPGLIGMLIVGILFQNIGLVDIDETYAPITKEMRRIALVVILIRAGLDMDPVALKRLWFPVMKIDLVPWTVEAGIVAATAHYFLDLPWTYAIMLGGAIGAISPAVVVPGLLRLRMKGFGVTKGIPTLIVAVTAIDDAISIAAFGIMKSIIFSHESVTMQALQGPVSIIAGLIFGIFWGSFCNYIPAKSDNHMVLLRVLLILLGGLFALLCSDRLGFGGAGPLGCASAAFVAICFWCQQGWKIGTNPVAIGFRNIWKFIEPVLFAVTGSQVKMNHLESDVVIMAIGILLGSAIIRALVTVLVGIGCNLNLKEKIFVALALMPKATVQAALGPVIMSMVEPGTPEYTYGKKILEICVLSIILTAPLGAILIALTGPRLLTKTNIPDNQDDWRRNDVDSIRDIEEVD